MLYLSEGKCVKLREWLLLPSEAGIEQIFTTNAFGPDPQQVMLILLLDTKKTPFSMRKMMLAEFTFADNLNPNFLPSFSSALGFTK